MKWNLRFRLARWFWMNINRAEIEFHRNRSNEFRLDAEAAEINLESVRQQLYRSQKMVASLEELVYGKRMLSGPNGTRPVTSGDIAAAEALEDRIRWAEELAVSRSIAREVSP